MTRKQARPFVPPVHHDTIRHAIEEALHGGALSPIEISKQVRIPEKEVYLHLEHLKKSVAHVGYRLTVVPAQCNRCGFRFTKRERLAKPGKCPVCGGQSITPPLFSLGPAE